MKNSFYIYFDGEKYISSKQVAALTGYAKDYIGQLCRLEKIKCQRSGRDWLVSEKSILNYKIKLSRLNEPTYVKTTADLGYLIRPLVFTAIFMTVITGFVLNLGSISKLTYQMKNDVTFPELPELSFPEIVLPKIALPQFSLPEIPKITFPKLAIPKIALPTKLSIPEISLPEISLTSLPSLPSLPSMPTLPKISFSLPEIRPLKVSLPSFSLAELFLPDFTLPKFSLPDLPTLSLPDFPKLSLPEIVLPKITLPKFPSWSFARLSLPFLDFSPPAEAMLQALRAGFPKISLPKVSFSLPEMHLPKIILALLPSLPDFSLPQITFPELPKLSLPEIVLPKIALPQFSLPEIPKITFPKLPFSLVLSLPSLPSLSFTKISPPSLPKMRLPDIHPFALKDIKDGFLGNLISWKDGFGAVSKISFSLPPPETHFSKIPKLSLLKLPDFSLPQITFPELPKLSLPEIPEITFPKLAMPKIVLPEFSLPKFSLPDFEFLKLSLPEFKLLELALPQFNLPNIEDLLGLIKIPTSPKLSWPNFSLPRISLPSFSLARLNSLRARLAALPPLPFTWEDSRLAILDIKNRFLEKLFSWKGYLASLDGDIKTEVADLPAGQAETPPPQIPSSNGGENEGSKIITFNTPSSPSFQTPPPQVKEIKTVVERVLSGISQSTLDQRLSDLNDSILLQVKNSLALIEKRIPSNQVQNPVVFLTTSIPGPSYNSPPQTGSGVSASFGDFSSGISTGGNLTASGNIILGQDTKTVDITSNTWKITSAGAASGFTSLSTDSLSASTFNVSGLLTTGGFISTASSTVVGNFTNQNATTTGYLAVTGMATSTFSNGIRLTGGCFLLLDGTCAGAGSGGITSLGGLTGATQTFSANGPLAIVSSGTMHTFNASSSPYFGALTASSTIIFSSLASGQLNSNGGLIYSGATTTFSSPLSYSGGVVSIPAATGGVNGYLSSTDWTLFNNKIGSTSLSATSPLSYNSSTGVIALNGTTTVSGLLAGNGGQ
ncbi:MAG: Periaxin, partial [Candidatus Giovannonibacteria bacterium GW2011_GWB1_43_13]